MWEMLQTRSVYIVSEMGNDRSYDGDDDHAVKQMYKTDKSKLIWSLTVFCWCQIYSQLNIQLDWGNKNSFIPVWLYINGQ